MHYARKRKHYCLSMREHGTASLPHKTVDNWGGISSVTLEQIMDPYNPISFLFIDPEIYYHWNMQCVVVFYSHCKETFSFIVIG